MNHIKKLIIAAALAGLSGAALADSASTTVNIGGEIGVSCAASAEAINLGQVTTYQLSQGIPVTMNLSVTCSSGSAYSISHNNGAQAMAGGQQLELQPDAPQINGASFGAGQPHADTGTGLQQSFAVSGFQVMTGNVAPTAGPVSGVFAGAFTISY